VWYKRELAVTGGFCRCVMFYEEVLARNVRRREAKKSK